jgi:hypothetical protein
METETISQAEWEDRQWWCFLLIFKGGTDSFSVTYQGIPTPEWLDDLFQHFGDYVIINPPVIIDRVTGRIFK